MVREDEREKIFSQQAMLTELTYRLDIIIHLLGGLAPKEFQFDFIGMSDEVLENRFLALLSAKNFLLIKRIFKKQFKKILNELKSFTTNCIDEENLIGNLNRYFITFLKKCFVIWDVLLGGQEEIQIAENFISQLHNLYCKCHNINYTSISQKYDGLWLQLQIINLVYNMGALAVKEHKPNHTKLLIKKGNPFDEYWKDVFWFRYVFTMLSRDDRLEKPSLCALALNFAKEHNLDKYFENEAELISSICQFDYLQCAESWLGFRDKGALFPSFGLFSSQNIIPIIKEIIKYYEKWLSRGLNQEERAKLIKELEEITSEYMMHLNINWIEPSLIAPEIHNFLNKIEKLQT